MTVMFSVCYCKKHFWWNVYTNIWVINMSIYRFIFIIFKHVYMSVYSWEYRQWPCRLEEDIECPGAIVKLSCELLLTASAKNLTQALWQRNIYFYLLIYLFSPKHYLKGSLMARIFSKIIVVETQMYDVTINHIVSIIKIFKSINLQRKKKVCAYVCVMWICMDMWICVKVQLLALPKWRTEVNFMYLPLLFPYIDFWASVSHWT